MTITSLFLLPLPLIFRLLEKKPTIQKFSAFLLLVIFTISFIPKSIFHDLIASHTDTISCDHPVKKAVCVHQQGFKCSFNDLVVTVPYVSFSNAFNFGEPVTYSSFTSVFNAPVLQRYFFGTESRGPPGIFS